MAVEVQENAAFLARFVAPANKGSFVLPPPPDLRKLNVHKPSGSVPASKESRSGVACKGVTISPSPYIRTE
jgi:hypothetical protein